MQCTVHVDHVSCCILIFGTDTVTADVVSLQHHMCGLLSNGSNDTRSSAINIKTYAADLEQRIATKGTGEGAQYNGHAQAAIRPRHSPDVR
jgi:hypothetical protein